jgi:hypothetical protein
MRFGGILAQNTIKAKFPLKTIFALIGCLLKGSHNVGIMIGPPLKAFKGGPIRIPHESISPNHNESLVY